MIILIHFFFKKFEVCPVWRTQFTLIYFKNPNNAHGCNHNNEGVIVEIYLWFSFPCGSNKYGSFFVSFFSGKSMQDMAWFQKFIISQNRKSGKKTQIIKENWKIWVF